MADKSTFIKRRPAINIACALLLTFIGQTVALAQGWPPACMQIYRLQIICGNDTADAMQYHYPQGVPTVRQTVNQIKESSTPKAFRQWAKNQGLSVTAAQTKAANICAGDWGKQQIAKVENNMMAAVMGGGGMANCYRAIQELQ
ncbi:MAG: hypothetical protein ACTHJ1_07660 [Bordetella sp.]|uniref:hypothetical protein n=1 Tax=Bordetella sp. TaxID=28081 RepID=UPI003F7BAEB8